MSKSFNFANFGNLYYYPGFKQDFFYFNSLLSNYERNPPNLAYVKYAQGIGQTAVSELSNIPGIGLEQKNQDDFLIDQISQILQILNAAIVQEKENEIKFVDDKIAMLKNNIDPKYYRKNQDLAAIEHFLLQLKTEDGEINYDALIPLLNIVEQGFENSKEIFNFEQKHLEDLDNAVKNNKQALENQIRGLLKTDKYRNKSAEEQEEILNRSLKKRDKLRVESYLKQSHLTNVPSFKKYMANMTTADYKIANWISEQIQNVLDNNYSTWATLLQNSGFTKNGYKTVAENIKEKLISSVSAFAAEHQAEILTDGLKTLDLNSFCNDLINDFNISLGTKISNVPDDFGLKENHLKLFEQAIEANSDTYYSAEGIYQALEEIMGKMKRKNSSSYSPEEQLIDGLIGKNTVTNFYDDTIEPINKIIKQMEQLIELEKNNKASIVLQRNNETKTIEAAITIDGNTITQNFSQAFSSAGLKLYQKKNYIPASLSSIVTNMKRAAGKKIRDEIVRIITSRPAQARKDLQTDMAHALQQIHVEIKGPEVSEILQGFDKTWSTKIWTGRTNVKNDVIEIVVGMPNGQETSMIVNNLLEGNINAINKPAYIKKFFQGYSEVFKDFQSQFEQAITNDMIQTRNAQEYTDYDKMAERFFKTQEIKNEMIKKINELYGQYKEELTKQIKDEEKRAKSIDNIERAAERFIQSIRDTLYVSSTMKTYTNYQNDLGFTGGSLGSTIDSQIESFDQLFTAAGMPIETTLKRWLKFAILNCSPVSVVGEKNKDFIENYLGGLAVFSLFNEGGAELTLLHQQLQNQELITTNNIMHLYRLNGIYYPGSYVLKQVVENLNMVVTQINEAQATVARKNIMIYNPASFDVLPNGKFSNGKFSKGSGKNKIFKTQNETNPWSYVGEKINSQVQIKVLFLAGLLDVVKNLHKQMEFELPQ